MVVKVKMEGPLLVLSVSNGQFFWKADQGYSFQIDILYFLYREMPFLCVYLSDTLVVKNLRLQLVFCCQSKKGILFGYFFSSIYQRLFQYILSNINLNSNFQNKGPLKVAKLSKIQIQNNLMLSCQSCWYFDFFRLVTSDVRITKGINCHLSAIPHLEVQLQLYFMMHKRSFGGQHLVVLLIADYHPPELLLVFRVVVAHHELFVERLVSAQLHLDLDLILLSFPQFIPQSHSWVSVTGLGKFLEIFALECFFSLLFFHVHEIIDIFHQILLSEHFGSSLIQDLHQWTLVDPHSLNQHLAELHTKYERFQMSQGRNHVDQGMRKSYAQREHVFQLEVELGSHLYPIEMKQDESVRFIDRFFANLRQILRNDFILFGFVLELDELLCLADQLDDFFQLHVFSYLLHISCQSLNVDVVIAADYAQVGSRQCVLLLLIYLQAFYVGEVLCRGVDEIGEIQADAFLVCLIHVIEIGVSQQPTVHEGPSQPINAFAFVGNALCDYCRVEMIVEVEMKSGLKRVGLEKELFVEGLFGCLAKYYELGRTKLFTLLSITLKNCRQTHELSHIRH